MTNEDTFLPTPEQPQPSAPTTDVVAEPPVHADEIGWTVGSWNDLANFECKTCPFSTLDLDKMEEHQKLRHAPEVPVDPDKPQAVTRRRYMRRD